MVKKKRKPKPRGFAILFLLSILLPVNVLLLRYLIFLFDPFCLKSFEGDPDWEPPEYYKDKIADSKIEEIARYGADNLVFSQSCNGKYKYLYDAENDKYIEGQYNIVRHAGATYALLDLYEEIGEERYREAGEAGLEYLFNFNYIINNDVWAINYNSKTKVGTVSLAILGMVRYWEATGDEKYNVYVEKYANFIVYQQRDDGAFAGLYGEKKEKLYYSGEAFFALALAYDMLEDDDYLEAMEDALDYYWTVDYEYDHAAFVPWASSGLAKWYELTDDRKFLDFCFEITDIQIARQSLVEEYDELGNNLYGNILGPTVNTGVYLEGIGDALRVAKSVSDDERIVNYYNCLKAGIEWITAVQFRKVSQLDSPNRGFGGFHRGFDVDEAYHIRIDYTQHAISALIRVLREFTDEEIKTIQIRNGKIDIDPEKVLIEESPLSWWDIILIIGLIATPIFIVYLHRKKKKKKKKINKIKPKKKK